MGEESERIALYNENYELIFSNFDIGDNNNLKDFFTEENSYFIKKSENKNYMIFSSNLSINNSAIYIMNIYDITDLYEERNREIKEIVFIDLIALGVACILIFILSTFLTKPIKELNATSKKIAKGNFEDRVNIKSDDEIGELASSFNIMAEEIENKVNSLNLSIKQKDDFINSFTHEIKTPMTAIIGYSDILRLKQSNDEEFTKKGLDYIYKESKRLELLSHKLMDLMALSEESIEFENIDVKSFISKVLLGLTNLGDIKVKLELEDSKVIGDKHLLEVVIRNLIENARKAEPKDYVIVVKGEIMEDTKKYRISVIDKGYGIPKAHIDRVTEDFYMADKSRSRESRRKRNRTFTLQKNIKISWLKYKY